MDRARLGPLSGLDSGTSGTYYFDSFESRRTNYIGPMAMGGVQLALENSAGRVDSARPSYRDHFASYQLAPPPQGSSTTLRQAQGSAFTAVADAYVAGDATTTNYGTSTTLRADNSPDLNSYLRFDLQGLTGNITSATLRIYANSGSSVGYDVYAVSDNTWTETGITYSNAPTMGTQLGSSGTFSANAWTTVDVTSYITGNGSYNLAFSTTSNTNTSFSSREGANAPELVIVTSGGATNTPTATNTPGPSPTPTRTPTPGATNTPTITPTAPPSFSSAAFVYDGDGKRVKSIFNGTITTYFVGAHYEMSGSTITKYYYAGAQRIAMRTNGTLSYLLGDHLGSTSLTTDAAGNKIYEQRYKAWGETRYTFGNPTTRYQYTSQFSYEAEFGLYFYNARWYDNALGRFAQADTIIPPGVQGLDRYAYVNNSPLVYIDPSGNRPTDPPWKISLAVNLATSGIPQNYWNPAVYPSEAQANYAANRQLSTGHHNLCGDISLSMILESATGRTDTLYNIYSASPSSRGWNKPTGSYTVGQQFAGSFPAGWSIYAVTYGEVARFEAGNSKETSYVSNSPNGTSNIASPGALATRFADMLASGHYVITAVTQLKSDPSGGVPGLVDNGTSNSVGHWVVVTGVSDNYVYINNPYTNRRERYTWKQFYSSWRHSWLEVIPPNNHHGDNP